MLIIHKLDDLGFKADTLEDLKKLIEDYYSVCGLKPNVTIEGDKVTVDVDIEVAQQTRVMFEKATQLSNIGKFDEAKVLLDKIEKLSPRFGDVHRIKAQIYFIHDHDNKKAMDACIEALRWNPKDFWALNLMGNILASEEDNDTAMLYYRKAIEYNPGDETATGNVAMLLVKKGEYDEAIEIYEKLVREGSNNAVTHYGLLLALMLKQDLQKAFDVGINALKTTKDNPENPGVRDEIASVTYKVALEIIKKTNKRNIFLGIKETVEDKLTMPMNVELDNDLEVYARMEYGPTNNRSYHVLRYKENAPANAFHTIIHEMMHLELNSEASKVGKNILIATNEESYRLFRKNHKTFLAHLKKICGPEAEKYTRHYFNTILRLVMNTPLDLFIEQRIYDKYRVLHPFQYITLYQESIDFLESIIAPSAKQALTPSIRHIARVCNMVVALHIERLYGIRTVNMYEATQKEMEQAKDLYDEFLAYQGCGAGEEYEYVEYFMQSLDMEDYFVQTNEKVFLARQLPNIETEDEEDKEVRRANEQFAKEHPDSPNSKETLMMSFYMLDALQCLDKLSQDEIKKIAIEISFIDLKGIDPNAKGYKVKSLDKTFGGYQLLAYYYVSWAIVFPENLSTINLPFSNAYELALKMYRGRKEK